MFNFIAKVFIKDYKNTKDITVRSKYGTLSGFVGVICNTLLFTAKLIAGILSGSISIIADAINNFTDATSSVVTMLGFKLSNRGSDAEHPFGHGRIEYVVGFIVSVIVLFVGFELIKTSIEKIIYPSSISISLFTVFILGASILIKLWMFFFYRINSKKIESAALRASAIDSLADVLATTVVLIGAIINYYTGIIIDGYVGSLVALFIFYAGSKSIKEIISLLLGTKPDKEFVEGVAEFVLDFDGICGVHDLVVHNYGPGKQMISLHAEVSSDVDIILAHELIDSIEVALQEKFLCEAVIHMDPIVTNNERLAALEEQVVNTVFDYNAEYSIHDFRVVEGNKQINLIFDVVTTYDKKLCDEQIKADIKAKIKQLDPKYNAKITVDKPFV